MFNATITSAFSSLAPFWSNEIVKVFSLGNEYTMAINMILSELIKLFTGYLTDDNALYLVTTIFIIATSTRFGFSPFSFILFNKSKTITISTPKDSESGEDSSKWPIAFKAINHTLIKKYNISQTHYSRQDNSVRIIDDMVGHLLEKDLYVTVKTDSDGVTSITLSTYRKNIHTILDDMVTDYLDSMKYMLTFTGTETNVSYNYPLLMQKLTHVFINKYGLNKLKVLSESAQEVKRDTDKTDKSEDNCKKSSKDLPKSNKFYVIDDYSQVELEPGLFLTIRRFKDIVRYILISNTHNLQQFVKDSLDLYQKPVEVGGYKSTLTISGSEINDYYAGRVSIHYPKIVIALCDYLITERNVTKYNIVDDIKVTKGKPIKIIGDLEDIYVDDLVINCNRVVTSKSECDNTIVTIKLESNTVNIFEYLEECVTKYDKKQEELNKNTIYYFKYQGLENKVPTFTTSILSCPSNPLNETFRNLSNEHIDRLMNDLSQLKDLAYYNKTGMRRKKSYLFHGEPGCGKNAAVVAMALHSKRHIIDIPFTVVKYNSEFNKLMNLDSINGVSFNNDEIIYMFDEMHVGISKFCTDGDTDKNLLAQSMSTAQDMVKLLAATTMVVNDKGCDETKTDYLDLGSILSQLDGIKNYGGVIYVGITNYIDKIPEPLKRSLRLSPVYFTYLRKVDVAKLIEQFYQIELPTQRINQLPDRLITPSSLCQWCAQYKLDDLFFHISELVSQFDSQMLKQIGQTDIESSECELMS